MKTNTLCFVFKTHDRLCSYIGDIFRCIVWWLNNNHQMFVSVKYVHVVQLDIHIICVANKKYIYQYTFDDVLEVNVYHYAFFQTTFLWPLLSDRKIAECALLHRHCYDIIQCSSLHFWKFRLPALQFIAVSLIYVIIHICHANETQSNAMQTSSQQSIYFIRIIRGYSQWIKF